MEGVGRAEERWVWRERSWAAFLTGFIAKLPPSPDFPSWGFGTFTPFMEVKRVLTPEDPITKGGVDVTPLPWLLGMVQNRL